MLDLHEYNISTVSFGSQSDLNNGSLTISKQDLEEAVIDAEYVESLEVDIARPGESVRIAGVIDVLEPRTKHQSGEATFPGIATDVTSCGSGETLALRGVAVTLVGEVPAMSETFVQEDSVIDMTGPGADYSPFSRLPNIVIRATLRSQAPDHIHIARDTQGRHSGSSLLGVSGQGPPRRHVRVPRARSERHPFSGTSRLRLLPHFRGAPTRHSALR